jgi:uncharacterized SAM-binding protein YcdF (DUF218 family)
MRHLVYMLLITIAVGTSSCGKIFTHATYQRAQQRGAYDAVIVPGFPYHADAKNINTIYKIRIYWAYHLYKTGMARNIIFSGGAVHTPYVEARIMAEYAKELGVPEEHIIIEDRAEHSTENLFYGYELAKERGLRRVAVATDPFQSEMIRYLTMKDNLPVEFIPAVVGIITKEYWNTYELSIDPSTAMVDDFVPLKQRLSKEERRRGTAGDRYRERPPRAAFTSVVNAMPNGVD